MAPKEAFAPEIEPEREEREIDIQDALDRAGFFDVKAPKPGTPAYERLLKAAEDYIREVVKGETKRPMPPMQDSENYFSKARVPVSSSDTVRREYHNQLCMMLLGGLHKDFSKEEINKVSNFAAYVTGHEEYINTW